MMRMGSVALSLPLGAVRRCHTTLDLATIISKRLSHQSLADEFPIRLTAYIVCPAILGNVTHIHFASASADILLRGRSEHLAAECILTGRLLSFSIKSQ